MTALLPTGPVLTRPRLGALPRAGGRFLEHAWFQPVPWAQRWRYEELDITTAIYLIADADHRLRWLGQANRADGLPGRLARHHADLDRRAVFTKIRVLQLVHDTPDDVLNAIEGRCADLLGIRESMRPRRWPSARNWHALVI
ncbi:hypothetical protein [Actinomadura livida]|uniref:GIY-YIG nuclease family protein n=1 Tax=Actinomadura livida TaxID=79909 RepID=A0A7W7I7I3_9ACTN|nr:MULTISPECIES: hypothetical protein [Actinomadura]MBB4771824.1 hypothetical protein [Actinomadura catellatispora]GGU02691.1 hypothetical protein GCM10010208_28470 [Actinomadura livida]